MSIRPLLAAALVTLGVVGCGADNPDPVEPAHSINEPWQPEPFAVGSEVLAGARGPCLDMQQRAPNPPPGLSLAVADARGGSKILLVYAGPNAETDCLVDILPNGDAGSTSGGSSAGDAFRPMAPGSVQSEGGSSSDDGANQVSSIVGRAGPGVARVVVSLAGGRAVVASLSASGWFAAWWPDATATSGLTAYDGTGTVTGVGR